MGAVEIQIEGTQELLRNLDKWDDKISDNTSDIIQLGAFEIAKKARRNASGRPGPKVQSGLLRAGIRKNKISKFAAVVLTSVDYASYVEFGTSRSRPYPYMRPAVEKIAPDIVKAIKRIVPK